MKGTYLGEFQELVLLTVMVLDGQGYGVNIQQELGQRIGRGITRGALHSALSRLEDKGFVKSEMGGATAERGGRQKRFYYITKIGIRALEEAQNSRNEFYQSLPQLITNLSTK